MVRVQISFTAFFIVFLVIGAAASDALANNDAARTQFDRGIELFEEKKFDQAAIAFERAYELKPSYKLLYNIGQTKNEIGDYTGARQAYGRYLEEGGENVPPDRIEPVREEIARLETLIGVLQIKGGEEGTVVYVDQREVGTIPLADAIYINIGEHEVLVKNGAAQLHSEIIGVAGGETVVVSIPDGAKKTEPVLSPKPKRRWTWVAMGIGAGSLLAGSVIGGVSVSKRKDIESQCPAGICDPSLLDDKNQVENLSAAADVLFAVGAVGMVTGLVLFFVEPRRSRERITPVVIGPTQNGSGLNLLLTRSF